MSDLLGFISIGLVSLLTLIVALRFSSIFDILLIALFLRVLLIIAGHYFIVLPDSTSDATGFEAEAWVMAQEGFFHVMSRFTGPDPVFITWLIAIPYSLFGQSIMLAQSISLLFGIGSVFLGWKVAKKVWNDRIAKKVACTIAIFPSLVLYSSLVLREAYIVFFLLLALYGVVTWVKTKNYSSIVLSMTGFIGATFFHGAMMLGGLVFLTIVGTTHLIKLFESLKNYRVGVKSLIISLIFVTLLGLYLSNKIRVSYLGNFASTTSLDNIERKTKGATRGTASWPEWTKVNSPVEMIYKLPIRAIYLIFAPFPWDVSELRHYIGIADAFLYIYLSFLIFCNIKTIWRDPTLRIFLLILLVYILVFGVGVGNFGTGIRHRAKFVVIFILLAAPLLKSFTYKKQSKLKY